MREGKKVSLGEPAPTPKPGGKGGRPEDAKEPKILVRKIRLAYLVAADDGIAADPSMSAMFFLEEDLHTGTKMTLYSGLFKKSSPDSRIFFLPRRLAEAIPFSFDKLSAALEKLDISQGSQEGFTTV